MSAAPPMFFLLAFGLSLPFYLLGAAGGQFPVPFVLPISLLMVFAPAVVALALEFREIGAGGARRLLVGVFDFRRVKSIRWLLAALMIMPLVFLLEYCTLGLLGTFLPVIAQPHW